MPAQKTATARIGRQKLNRIIEDIKRNGSFYTRNRITVNELKAFDKNVKSKWDSEAEEYLLTYEYDHDE